MPIILGSRSPRRRELLEPVVGADELRILPPRDSNERGFDGLNTTDAIRRRLQEIVQTKRDDVLDQIQSAPDGHFSEACCITADTIVVAKSSPTEIVVLGQPRIDHWQDEVRDWMLRLYSGRTHEVWTGYQVCRADQRATDVVRTTVEFAELTPTMVDRYLRTCESIGKAGGYAVQGAAAAFVQAIRGSLTNVIGLPVLEITRALHAVGYRVPGGAREQ